MGIAADLGQNTRITALERKLRRLEKKSNGGVDEMKIFRDLVGQECMIDGDGFFATKCRIIEVDEDWVKLVEHTKKSDITKIVRIDSIESVTLISE